MSCVEKKKENAECREEAVGRGTGVSWVVLLSSEAEEEKRERERSKKMRQRSR